MSRDATSQVQVRVTFIGLIQRLAQRREETFSVTPDATLGDLVRALVARFGPDAERYLLENGDVSRHATILIDGRNALSQGGLMAKLGHSIEVVVLGPPLMGG